MRPLRIAVEGFAAFRDAAVVDLTDVELFALVGPTGAGKSSVIDAMVFALYGAVPRYDSENLVHPVITQGALEARVRLDFSVAGTAYTATRVVKRTKAGATTKEARLERVEPAGPTTVLADDAKALSAAVTDLLGLDLEQFTKCVVLPQGAFATLLHDTKAKRQDLLVKLLDLGVYERIAAAARAEAKSVSFRLESLDDQIGRLVHATADAERETSRHVDAVDAVVAALDQAGPELVALDEQRRARRCGAGRRRRRGPGAGRSRRAGRHRRDQPPRCGGRGGSRDGAEGRRGGVERGPRGRGGPGAVAGRVRPAGCPG